MNDKAMKSSVVKTEDGKQIMTDDAITDAPLVTSASYKRPITERWSESIGSVQLPCIGQGVRPESTRSDDTTICSQE